MDKKINNDDGIEKNKKEIEHLGSLNLSIAFHIHD